MVKLTAEQYSELKAAQDQMQAAQANLARVCRLLGLDMAKAYSIPLTEPLIPVEEVVVQGAPLSANGASPTAVEAIPNAAQC